LRAGVITNFRNWTFKVSAHMYSCGGQSKAMLVFTTAKDWICRLR